MGSRYRASSEHTHGTIIALNSSSYSQECSIRKSLYYHAPNIYYRPLYLLTAFYQHYIFALGVRRHLRGDSAGRVVLLTDGLPALIAVASGLYGVVASV